MTWHHAPAHHFAHGNTFFITGATHYKQHFYRETAALDELQELLIANAEKHQCWLQSWCLLTNHYHLVVRGDGAEVREMVTRLHVEAALARNKRDGVKGRKCGSSSGTRRSRSRDRGWRG